MKILLVTATTQEVQPLHQYLSESGVANDVFPNKFTLGKVEITWLVTGVGLTFTAFHLGQQLAKESFELVVNAGIAGAFPNASLSIGEVVEVQRAYFADLGAETAEGGFLNIFELGLVNGNVFPFENYWLENPGKVKTYLKLVSEISVNRVHGSDPSIKMVRHRLDADIETMEGAAFFYACLHHGLPFMSVRAISNWVEPRNRDAWNIPLAIKELNNYLINWIKQLSD